MIEVLPFLNDEPEKDLNDWQEAGLKEKAHWGWLNELPRDGKPGRGMAVQGMWRHGELVGDLDELQPTIY